jgi:hypothetical protein
MCLTDIVSELSTSFAVQRQSDHGFSAVSCDQTIEQTINCDSKNKGGLIGFSLNRAAIHRWLLAQSERAAITNKCKDMASADAKPRLSFYSTLPVYITHVMPVPYLDQTFIHIHFYFMLL